MTPPSVAALARSYRTERVVITLVGVLALALGVLALVVGAGWVGSFRALRPVLDPIAMQTLGDWPNLARGVAIAAGVLLAVLGVLLVLRTLRPERHPDLALDESVGSGLVVTAGAIAEAISADAEQVSGVDRARATVVGDPETPALRLSVWLAEGARVKDVWRELDASVLTRARESLGVESLPTAVRVEMGAAERQRVR
ncbi:alkaline shock response membrane anchor protein AmaP [Actinokineospora pegani]|uniref:alkaline shock response membrane anchor protein AmaP n=1 Tax=Actinokineospora pegani TaxID=2654637 RepID=UPI0012E999C1|nr:alkaline shock response membrane anchor protein AmaP [Actinokineospora pegani]